MLKQRELRDLQFIVGDPNAAESAWLPACAAAGTTSLVVKSPLAWRLWSKLQSMSGAVLAVFASLFSYVCVAFSAAHVTGVLSGVDLNWFLNESGPDIDVGVAFLVAASIQFWIQLTNKTVWLKKLATVCLTGLLALLCVGWVMNGAAGFVGGLALAVLLCGSVALVGSFGNTCRMSLPRVMNSEKLAASSFCPLLVPGLFMIWALSSAVMSPRSDHTYSTPDFGSAAVYLFFIAWAVFLPGLSVALSSRSKSLIACGALSLITQTPLIAALFLCTILSCVTALLASVSPAGLALLQALFPGETLTAALSTALACKAVTLSLTLLTTAGLSYLGGLLGAGCNKLRYRKKALIG